MTSPSLATELRDTLLWLCAIDSPIGEEAAICDAVKARLERLPLAAPIRRYSHSIVVPVSRGAKAKGRPHVALCGHFDTVRTENGKARIEGDRVFGAGASDMKSGLAVMIALAEHWHALGADCDLTLVFYAREEGPFAENELGPVLAEDKELLGIDLAVCLEPSDNKMHLGCCGSIHAELTFEGKTGHSARPWEGDNAIYRGAAFLTDIASAKPEECELEGVTYRSVFTVTRAWDGGRGRNIVPDRFVVNLNHRFAPKYSLEEAEQNLRRLVGDRARIHITDLSPAAPPNAANPLVRALAASGVAGVAPKQAWTDVARFAALGIPAVNLGPGENAQAHQKNESTGVGLIVEGYEIFRRWLTDLPSSS
ncbi:MAG: succinyl-diaminopimelate desuccinylase [Polyangiaceae bacterium]